MSMSLRANERVAWFNGEFMPEREVRIPFRDSSWVYGDGCFDMTRTFGHRLFKVKEHVDRLYRSLKYLRIDPGFGPRRMCELTEEVFARNHHLLGPDDDYWVGQRISRGVKEVPGDNLDHHGPNVVLECAPLPFVQRAKLFREGIRVITPAHRRVPPDSLTPRAKTHNYLNLIVANQEAQSIDPEILGGAARRQRQPGRGHGLEHFCRARWGDLHPTGKIRAAGREPADRDRPRARGRPRAASRPTSTSTTPTTATRFSSLRPRCASARSRRSTASRSAPTGRCGGR